MFALPRVYISVAPQDESYALAVINGLLPRTQVWSNAMPATLTASSQEAIQACDWFIVIQTPEAAATPSVQGEIQMALAAHAAQPKRGLVAIIAAPVDVSQLPVIMQRLDAVNQPVEIIVQYIARIMELPGAQTPPFAPAMPPPMPLQMPPPYGTPMPPPQPLYGGAAGTPYDPARSPAPPFISAPTPWPAMPEQYGAMHPRDVPAGRLPTLPGYRNPNQTMSRRVLLAGGIGAAAVAVGGVALFAFLHGHTLTSTGNRSSTTSARPTGTAASSATATPATSATFLPDGQFLFSCNGHTDVITMVAWAPHGGRLASGSGKLDGTVRIWSDTTGQQLFVYSGHTLGISSVDFSHSGTLIASSANDGTVQIWDPGTGNPQLAGIYRKHFGGGAGALSAARWSPNDQLIASVGADAARVWDAATGNDVIAPVPIPNGGAFSDVSWSPDGRSIALGSFADQVIIIDVASGNTIQTWTGEQHPIQAVAWSPTASIVASADNRPGVYLFDPQSGQLINTYAGNGSGINALAWTHDGAYIASAGGGSTASSGDLRVLVWNAQTLETVSMLSGHGAYVNSVAWSPDNTRIASGSDDRTIQVWKVR